MLRDGRRAFAFDLVVLASLLIVAAALRLPDLATRGRWDVDQGRDMILLRAFVQHGAIPLLGPPTSIGGVHHGALYYAIMSPAAFLSGGDSPLAVVLEIGLIGIAAVGLTWWLARSIAGPMAGLVAGGLMAVSSSAVEQSTFIWNPNPIAATSALALAAAWRAWTTRRARWWLVAAVGVALTIQLHILGVLFAPIVAALWVADLRRRTDPSERAGLRRVALGSLGIVAVTWIPWLIHELGSDFAESRALAAFLTGGGESSGVGYLARVGITLLRTLSWPLTGLVTAAPLAALIAAALVAVIVVVGSLLDSWPALPAERTAVRWLGLGLGWSALTLAVAAPSLATVVDGLPNDQYHAFADPIVWTLMGVGSAAAWRIGAQKAGASPGRATLARGAVAVVIGALVAWNLANQPPATAPGGDYPDTAAAAVRIEALAGPGGTIALRALPSIKTPEGIAYPLIRDGRTVIADGSTDPTWITPASPGEPRSLTVVVCDALLVAPGSPACGGPAETADLVARPLATGVGLVDRFTIGGRMVVSIYGPT